MSIKVKETERIIYFDFLRALAIVAVIMLHSAAYLTYQKGQIPSSWWYTAVAFVAINKWAVPVFFMISGALLLNREPESIRQFLRKRFARVAIPLAFWTVVYGLWVHYRSHESLLVLFKKALSEPIYYHLWFVYVLLGLYLAVPILQVFVQQATEKQLRYFLILWFFVNAIVSIFDKFLGIHLGIDFTFFAGYIGYFILGYYLATTLLSRLTRNVSLLLIVASLSVGIFGTLAISRGRYDEYFQGYLTANVMLFGTGAFLLAKQSEAQLVKLGNKKLVLAISSASFGIYLIHPLIQDVLGIVLSSLHVPLAHPIIQMPMITAIIGLASFCIISALRRVPGVKSFI